MKKRFISTVTALALAVTSIFSFSGTNVQAKASATTVKKAYASYVKKNIANDSYFIPGTYYYLHDFNKDGIKEMIVVEPGGARGSEYVYSYYNGKVVSSYKEGSYFNQVGYIKGEKCLVGYGSGGYQDFEYVVYKISKGKLKEKYKYACEEGVYKKDGKKITEKSFNKFTEKVSFSYSAKKYQVKAS